MRSDRRWWISLCAALVACQGNASDEAGSEPELEAQVVRSEVTPPPISGGTLILVDEGRTAVAADPDRDLVHVVDLFTGKELHTIELSPGDEPGRLVEDDAGIVHVVARRGGSIIDIDPTPGVIERRRVVCANPRGIAYGPEDDALHVACAGGDLVTMPAQGGSPTRRVHVAPDLRDVLYTRHGLAVTRFRSAEVLQLDDEGRPLEHHGLPVLQRSIAEHGQVVNDRMYPNTAWRTLPTPDGSWLMLHQVSTERSLEIDPPDEGDGGGAGDRGGGSDDGGGGYAASVVGSPCATVTHPVVTMGEDTLTTKSSPLFMDTVLPVDAAISPNGERIVMAVAGNRVERSTEIGVAWIPTDALTADFETGCRTPNELPMPEGQYTAVAVDWRGWIIAQSRSPAQLVRIDPDIATHPEIIPLAGPSRLDTGHDLFHLDAGGGISCATCHPEGGDDGQVWRFAELGPRHTPALAIGLEGTAPFHWEGEFTDMRELVDDVHMGRMGGAKMSDAWVGALESFMYSIPVPTPVRASSDAAAERGASLFTSWGCDQCHQGEALAGSENVWLGFDYSLQVPGLRGVAMHPPFMHDGRAEDLDAAVRDMLARTRPDGPDASDAQIADMVAYLESI